VETIQNNLLLIFTRNPELGKCKTRLAATVGDKTALEIYTFLLEHTAKITSRLNVKKKVYYSIYKGENDIWNETVYEKAVQEGEDLGIRMANAFKDGFKAGYKNIIIIGSDVFNLSSADLNNAFTALEKSDYVVGPAEDGGYYLLGMRNFTPSLFKDKVWGTETVLADTLSDLRGQQMVLLEERNDVDRYEDIKDIAAFQHFLKNV